MVPTYVSTHYLYLKKYYLMKFAKIFLFLPTIE